MIIKKLIRSSKTSLLATCVLALSLVVSCIDDPDIDLNGTIIGKVSNALTGDPIAAATVSLSGLETKSETIGSDGLYRFENLVTGTYTITVAHAGYDENSVEISLQPGEVAEGDIALSPITPIEITPSQLDFSTAFSDKQLTISNNSGAAINYEIQLTSEWITLNKSGGTLESLTQDLLSVTIDRTKLNEGNSETTIVFNVPGRGTKSVQVLVEKLSATSALLQINEGTLNFGEDLSSVELEVSNAGSGVLSWNVDVSEDWLSTNPVQGTIQPGEKSTLSVFVIRDALTNGDYTGQLNFSGNGGTANVNVSMNVNISGGGGGNPNGDDDNDGVVNSVDADDDDDGLIELFTINDLHNIRSDLRALGVSLQGAPSGGFIGYELVNDLDFENDSDYSDLGLKSDVTSGLGWSPIGVSGDPLSTIFEGNEFTISNLLLNRTTDYNGLFGQSNNLSEIRNINIEVKFFSGDQYSGGLIGYNDSGLIDNCSVVGDIKGGSDTGGLIGYETNGTISNSFTEGSVTSTGGSGIGGLIGTYRNGSAELSTISNCYSTSRVQGIRYIGGLVGYRSSGSIAVTSCYATGAVSGSDRYVGGFGGYITGDITSCYATGSATSSEIYVGGFIGRLNGGSISNSFSTGTVAAPSNFGGFAGNNSGSISATNYWDTEKSEISTSFGEATGLTTAELQTPTSSTGIYVTWNSNLWDFGNESQYPVLKDMPNGTDVQRN